MARTARGKGIKWQGGGLEALGEKIGNIQAQTVDAVADVMRDEMANAAFLQARLLEAAETPFGRERFARGQGNGPGRDDTGNMIDSIEHEVRVEGNTVIGEWGWDDPDRYIMIQEHGLARMDAANSLAGSFVATRESVRASLKRAVL